MLQHYLEFGTYTYPGLYQERLKNDLPDDIKEIGFLVRKSLVHRSTMHMGNVGTNADMRFGDMTKMPWWRQSEDDYLVTASAMLAEMYRRDPRGFVSDRTPENKLVLTCRFTAVLMASILKSKGIPARCRAVHHYAPYFDDLLGKVSADHWINQYWNKNENRWVTVDADASLSVLDGKYDPYDMPLNAYDFPADAWLKIRRKEIDPNYFYNGDGTRGTVVILWSLMYDFHSLMNDEVPYTHIPSFSKPERFEKLSGEDSIKIDHLARLMQSPEDNFDELVKIWETDKDFRILTSPVS